MAADALTPFPGDWAVIQPRSQLLDVNFWEAETVGHMHQSTWKCCVEADLRELDVQSLAKGWMEEKHRRSRA